MSKYLKINWGSEPSLVPIKETFLAFIASLQKQINDKPNKDDIKVYWDKF